jgi:hypothetical protein
LVSVLASLYAAAEEKRRPVRCLFRQKPPTTARSATIMPTAIPAIAPPLRPLGYFRLELLLVLPLLVGFLLDELDVYGELSSWVAGALDVFDALFLEPAELLETRCGGDGE